MIALDYYPATATRFFGTDLSEATEFFIVFASAAG
jgi:hypothetical protein